MVETEPRDQDQPQDPAVEDRLRLREVQQEEQEQVKKDEQARNKAFSAAPGPSSSDGRPLGRPDHPGAAPPADKSETVQAEYQAVKAAAEGKDDAGLEAGTVPGLSSAVLEILAVEREAAKIQTETQQKDTKKSIAEKVSGQLSDQQEDESQPAPDAQKVERDRLMAKTAEQLRDEIRKRNTGRPAIEHLSTTGSKQELVDRLMADREVK